MALIAATAFAAPRSRVVITVDVESMGPLRLPDQIDAICQGGGSCGVLEIARLLDNRGWAGTFFLNVYEHHAWGKRPLQQLTAALQFAHQDVALHTHPHWAYDAARWGMHQYTLDEQVAIVGEGVQLLQEWAGRPVVAHRAGAYAADYRTLQALERQGVLLDSSEFWQHPNSRLGGLNLPRNWPGRYGRVTEVPVTVYFREDRPTFFSSAFAPITTVRKLDVDWFSTEEEMRNALDAAVESDIPLLVVFLHSFSFMTAGTDGQVPTLNRQSYKMFKALLDHIAVRNLTVVTMRELAAETLSSDSGQDVVPRVAVTVPTARYVWRVMRTVGPQKLLVGSLVIVGFAAVVVRRGKSRARK